MYLTSPVFPVEMLGFMVNCKVSCYDRRTDKMGHQVSLNVPSYIMYHTACCTSTDRPRGYPACWQDDFYKRKGRRSYHAFSQLTHM
ncbi:hypothetical protein CY34DRAFT_797003 [Suillus luteus UH-Slu-Lm8-n1]|uniref:Uncharacterized protein n=1 Tax=Suillus luteus UH-Slu-Lm8-n1 TaxID=930992 RepID=A0A0D0BVK4_9AGAM|nr:hypothetical protein CY34DRAFT_797003 [Suillus luteus UH-Slu-Lm8-n1]